MAQNIIMQYLNSDGKYVKIVPSTIASDNSCFLDTQTAKQFGLGPGATPKNVFAEIAVLLDKKAPDYTYGTEDLTAGVTELATGKLHFVYE